MDKQRADERFEALFAAQRQPLYRYLYRLTGSPDAAEELVQASFVKAYGAIGRLPQDANERAWLYRIATNAANDRFRRNCLCEWLPLRDESDQDEVPDHGAYTGESGPAMHDLGLDVQKALSQLPDKYRAPLLLYGAEELSVNEIAQVLGIGVSAVKMRLLRAREMFRKVYDV
ncbi:MAG: RNA polymerase sigma factor [Chloroflexi bacterium]|nr:RNA polymerase sigma factor [Chloroflexota bacterium]